jgi:hypothetical protein
MGRCPERVAAHPLRVAGDWLSYPESKANPGESECPAPPERLLVIPGSFR